VVLPVLSCAFIGVVSCRLVICSLSLGSRRPSVQELFVLSRAVVSFHAIGIVSCRLVICSLSLGSRRPSFRGLFFAIGVLPFVVCVTFNMGSDCLLFKLPLIVIGVSTPRRRHSRLSGSCRLSFGCHPSLLVASLSHCVCPSVI
jgi:hypothetical protein